MAQDEGPQFCILKAKTFNRCQSREVSMHKNTVCAVKKYPLPGGVNLSQR